MHATVIGGGISGVACANVLALSGQTTHLRDRGHRLGGRMASRTLHDTGTDFDGRAVDIGASYFTARDPAFVAEVDRWVAAGVVQPWTTSFHVADPSGIQGVTTGPMRYSAPRGLRTVVESMVSTEVTVTHQDDVASVDVVNGVAHVDDVPSAATALCMPMPQAQRLYSGAPSSEITWEPVIAVVDLDQDLVLLVERSLDLLPQDRRVEEILHPNAQAGDLVAVGRADAAAGGADLGLAEETLGHLVQSHVIRRDQVRIGADDQFGRVDPLLIKTAHLLQQDRRVDHDAVPDHWDDRRSQDAAGQQMKSELPVTDDDGVAGVVPTLVANDIVHATAEQIGRLPLAFVTPLGTDEHDCRHGRRA